MHGAIMTARAPVTPDSMHGVDHLGIAHWGTSVVKIKFLSLLFIPRGLTDMKKRDTFCLFALRLPTKQLH